MGVATLERPARLTRQLPPPDPMAAELVKLQNQPSLAADSPTIDLLMVYSPPARLLPSRNGVRRWEYCGRIYREIPLESLYRDDDDVRAFRRMDAMVRAKPYRG